MTHKIVYPGTFDPLTFGHIHLIERATHLFDQVIVAIAADTHKKSSWFNGKERLAMAKEALAFLPQVRVCAFNGLLVHFLQKQKINLILRGVRAGTDFEFEYQLAMLSKQLDPQIETVLLMPDPSYAHISASMIREVAKLGGDVSAFVPKAIAKKIKARAKGK